MGKERCDIEPSWGIEIRVSVRSERRPRRVRRARCSPTRSVWVSGILIALAGRREREKKWKQLSHEREKKKKRK